MTQHRRSTAGSLNEHTRRAALALGTEETFDVVVIGLGVTGAGVALDAASRGLKVLALEANDLAFGTSRWSSKLVHGGLRYLAKGQLGVAHESAVERGILITRTAPHLTFAMPMVIPLTPGLSRPQAALAMQGLRAGDALRAAARTPRSLLGSPRRLGAAETLRRAPMVNPHNLRGGLLSFDGQLEDDARLVVALARTAASYGANVVTRARVTQARGDEVEFRDELSGQVLTARTRSVVNATGVWADQVVPGLRLTPSRGTHLVLRASALPGLTGALSAPVPGSLNRFVFAVAQPDGLIYLGLTDERAEGPVPDEPQPEESEIEFLLRTFNTILGQPLTRDDVVGTFAGLRPLLSAEGSTSDLSRKHAVMTSETGVVTVVGGKLTTYRRMAQDAVDHAVAHQGLTAGRCRTTDLPLLGAAPRAHLAGLRERSECPRLVRRYGVESSAVLSEALAHGWSEQDALSPLSDDVAVTRAELLFAVRHEGALSVEDLLERRTRISMVSADANQVRPIAEQIFDTAWG